MANFADFDTHIEELEKTDIDYEELFNKVNSSVITDKLPKSSTISRKQALNNINKAYQNDKLVLVLGAGISLEFGVPTWNELLQNLMVYSIEKEHKVSSVLSKFYNEIFRPNPLIAGRYLQDYFAKDNSSFESMVRDVLYSNVDKSVNSRLLDEIVRLCVKPDIHHNLDSIISYNFDDILECKLEKAEVNIPFKPIFGLGMETKNGELPIYHVHGYLPEKRKLDLANKIIFGENNYHQQYSDIYSWNNIVQINKFRENTCLLIGSSLTDPNIRRLLDIALKQKGNRRKHHYIFKERIKISTLKEKLNLALTYENLSNKNHYGLNFDETIELLKGIYERFEENDSASFGVQTIWIDDWKEVPKILKKMRENVA
ncbi:SIR2 family protein [Ancylomarina sp. 16SWW S1-10-2]|uniref:SIR2 family protein n=1 Tax=Ancylomarina sp. 16SWW S1-10-2 TaxID=2499681 RepID=UPI0012AE5508|nr:SIR2 family protein [Ancylomarina sp. 16SWW S1-10-2]MRT91333.1 hypothetical protein [Ancylomarina sp. 16SWW S1-10-2]